MVPRTCTTNHVQYTKDDRITSWSSYITYVLSYLCTKIWWLASNNKMRFCSVRISWRKWISWYGLKCSKYRPHLGSIRNTMSHPASDTIIQGISIGVSKVSWAITALASWSRLTMEGCMVRCAESGLYSQYSNKLVTPWCQPRLRHRQRQST